MHILYIHQYFRTPGEGGSTRSYELARGLIEHGHEVTMITAHNQRRGLQTIDGILVRYLQVHYQNEYGFLRRVFAYLKFVFLAKRAIKRIQNIDLAYVMTTPLTTGLIALHLQKKRNIPYYFEVGDLWPAAPIQMGAIKNSWMIKRLEAFERKCYTGARKVIALSPAIQAYIQHIIPSSEIEVIPNLADCSFFKPTSQKVENNSKINIGYFGTFGKANGLEYFMTLARTCEEKDLDIRFHLMGEGAETRKLKALANKLINVTFHSFGNKNQVRTVMDNMDAIYVSFKNIDILNTGSPNKFFDGLAMGKLIIINFGGWIRSVIEENNCGFYHDPLHPEDFIEKITPFLNDPARLETHGRNSRQVAEKYFDKPLLIEKLVSVIDDFESQR